MLRWFPLVALLLSAGCLRGATFDCEVDAQCLRPDDEEGECIDQWCAYFDDDCASELRFSDNASPEVAGTCVNNGEGVTSDDSTAVPPSTTTAAASTSTSTGDGSSSVASTTGPCLVACDGAPSACFGPDFACAASTEDCTYSPLPEGVVCDDGDPCSQSSTCSGLGACIGHDEIVCNDAPSDCFISVGTCDPQTGDCDYTPIGEGEACDDGNACTTGETCDAAGVCGGGEACPSDPCSPQACVGGRCTPGTMLADGSSCGPDPADRCCGGACTDISTSELHCGGCDTPCAEGFDCESVDLTLSCDPQPAATTGRCECAGGGDCPRNQICRAGEPNKNNRCAPDVASQCAGEFQDVQLCPNYCFY